MTEHPTLYQTWLARQPEGSLIECDPPSLLIGFKGGVKEESERIQRELDSAIYWLRFTREGEFVISEQSLRAKLAKIFRSEA